MILSSCRKNDPQPVDPSTTPPSDLGFSGLISGVPVDISVGENGYYVEPTFRIDNNNIVDYTTLLKSESCTTSNCENSLTITMRGNAILSANNYSIDSSIWTGFHPYSVPTGAAVSYNQTFIGSLINGKGDDYTWDFGDGSPIVSGKNATVNHVYPTPGIYNVTLTTKDSSQCSSSISNQISVGPTYYNSGLSINAYVDINNDFTVNFTPTFSYSSFTSLNYSWDFGDGTKATTPNPSHTYASPGTYLVKLTIDDGSGHTYTNNKHIAVKDTISCSSNFTAPSANGISNPLNLSTIEVEWTDYRGVKWTSSNDLQLVQNSAFEIISVEEYLTTPNGDKTKKIKVKFNCAIYNDNNAAINIENATAVIAIAYP